MLVCAISFQTHKGAEEGQGTSDDRRDDHVQGPAGADTAAIQQLIAQQEPRCKAQGKVSTILSHPMAVVWSVWQCSKVKTAMLTMSQTSTADHQQ